MLMGDEPVKVVYDEAEWRAIWERLDKPTRREIQGSLLRGAALHDVRLAALAAGMAFRARQPALRMMVAYVVLAIVYWVWISFAGADATILPEGLQIALAVVSSFLALGLVILYRNLQLAEVRNTERVEGKSPL